VPAAAAAFDEKSISVSGTWQQLTTLPASYSGLGFAQEACLGAIDYARTCRNQNATGTPRACSRPAPGSFRPLQIEAVKPDLYLRGNH
jgi:hypothetical protein